jgi:hypothetical protein
MTHKFKPIIEKKIKQSHHNSEHYPSSFLSLKLVISESGFCIRLQEELVSSLRKIVLNKGRDDA